MCDRKNSTNDAPMLQEFVERLRSNRYMEKDERKTLTELHTFVQRKLSKYTPDETTVFLWHVIDHNVMKLLLDITERSRCGGIELMAASLFDLIGLQIYDQVVTSDQMSEKFLETLGASDYDLVHVAMKAMLHVRSGFNCLVEELVGNVWPRKTAKSTVADVSVRPRLVKALHKCSKSPPGSGNHFTHICRYYQEVMRKALVFNEDALALLRDSVIEQTVRSDLRQNILSVLCPTNREEISLLLQHDAAVFLTRLLREPDVKRQAALVLYNFVVYGTPEQMEKLIDESAVETLICHLNNELTEDQDAVNPDTNQNKFLCNCASTTLAALETLQRDPKLCKSKLTNAAVERLIPKVRDVRNKIPGCRCVLKKMHGKRRKKR